MNLARVAAAAVVAWIVSIGIGFIVNAVILEGLLMANAAAFRPEADMMAKLPLGFGFMLVGFFAFAYAYAKGYEGGSGVGEGLRFGLLVGVMLACFAMIWAYVTTPITGSLGAAWCVDALVEFAVYGAVVGAIYEPVGTAARRTAVV